MGSQSVVHPHHKRVLSNKKKEGPVAFNYVDVSQIHRAKSKDTRFAKPVYGRYNSIYVTSVKDNTLETDVTSMTVKS